mmetsp:Transcript_13040/g.28357  ORF Transcript_13040/g.28357 Transcript_13040/m.28357 type:complete len:119 (+) Transcript_13040:225-581(+)
MKTSKCILAVVVAAALLIAAASAQTVCKCSKQKVFGGCTVLTSNGDGTCNSELVSPCSPCACDADGSLECEVAMGSAYAFTVAPACESVETSYAICPETPVIEQESEQQLKKAEFQRI